MIRQAPAACCSSDSFARDPEFVNRRRLDTERPADANHVNVGGLSDQPGFDARDYAARNAGFVRQLCLRQASSAPNVNQLHRPRLYAQAQIRSSKEQAKDANKITPRKLQLWNGP